MVCVLGSWFTVSTALPNDVKLPRRRKKPVSRVLCVGKGGFGGNYFVTFRYRICCVFCGGVRDHQLLCALYEPVTMYRKSLVNWLLGIFPQKLQPGLFLDSI